MFDFIYSIPEVSESRGWEELRVPYRFRHHNEFMEDVSAFVYQDDTDVQCAIRQSVVPRFVNPLDWYFREAEAGDSQIARHDCTAVGVWISEIDYYVSDRKFRRIVQLSLQPPWLYGFELSIPAESRLAVDEAFHKKSIPDDWAERQSGCSFSVERLKTTSEQGVSFDLPESWCVAAGTECIGMIRCVNQPIEGIVGRIDVINYSPNSTPTQCVEEYLSQLKSSGIAASGGLLAGVVPPRGFDQAHRFFCRLGVGKHRLACQIHVLTHASRKLLISMLSPHRDDARDWWAINKAAYELAVATISVNDLPSPAAAQGL